MTTLLSALSFALAFGAFWFSSEVAKRSTIRSKLAMKPHLEPVTAALQKSELRIRQLTKGLEQAEREIQALRAEISDRHQHVSRPDEVPLAAQSATLDAKWEVEHTFRPTGAFNAHPNG